MIKCQKYCISNIITSSIIDRATFYAEPIKRMCDAGAIPVAVTNVPELCMWMETSNR